MQSKCVSFNSAPRPAGPGRSGPRGRGGGRLRPALLGESAAGGGAAALLGEATAATAATFEGEAQRSAVSPT
jgi:hypothetical protein